MATRFYLDTNALILLSGLNEDLSELKKYLSENNVELSVGQVQIDEKVSEEIDFNQKIEKAVKKLKTYDIDVKVEPTIEAILGVSRLGYCKFGSEELGKIDGLLRSEIQSCERKPKTKLNLACDALIALSSLNHDYFITADECMFRSWKKVVEDTPENKETLQKTYSLPEVIHCKKPKGVLNAIMCR